MTGVHFQSLTVSDYHRALSLSAQNLGRVSQTIEPGQSGRRWPMIRDSEGNLVLLESFRQTEEKTNGRPHE